MDKISIFKLKKQGINKAGAFKLKAVSCKLIAGRWKVNGEEQGVGDR